MKNRETAIYGPEFNGRLNTIVQDVLNGGDIPDTVNTAIDLENSDFAGRQLLAIKGKIERRKKRRAFFKYSSYAAAAVAVMFFYVHLWNLSDGEAIQYSASVENLQNSSVKDGSVYVITENSKKVELTGSGSNVEQILQKVSEESSKDYIPKTTTVVVPKGREYNIDLPDGTRVWLGANSLLKFPSEFAKEAREVYIEGEGYFNVAHDKNSPFIVKTHNINTKVFGTEFIVNSFKSLQINSVALLSGSVEVKNVKGTTIKLTPGQKASSSEKSLAFYVEDIDIENLRGITQGMFVFWGAKIGDIVPILSNWYDYDIQVDEDLREMVFYIRVDKKSSIENIAELLSKTNLVNYTIDNQNKQIKLNYKKEL